MPKIIQICCAVSESSNSLGKDRLYALTDTGQIWTRLPPNSKGVSKWELMEPIPFKEEKEVNPTNTTIFFEK